MDIAEFKTKFKRAVQDWENEWNRHQKGLMLWHSRYKEVLVMVEAKRAELKRGEKLNAEEHYDFLYELLYENGNGVSLANTGRIEIEEKFESLIRDDVVLKAIKNVIIKPNADNGEYLFNAIYNHNVDKKYEVKNNWLIVNRVIAASTDEVSSTVDRGKFCQIFNFLVDYNIIADYPNKCIFLNWYSEIELDEAWENEMKTREWYDENIHLMSELRKIFVAELNSGEVDVQLISMYVWELWKEKFKNL